MSNTDLVNHYALLLEAFRDQKIEIKVKFEFSFEGFKAETNFLELGEKYRPLHELAESMPHAFIYNWESARKHVQEDH
jgi:hypothetical protein